MKNLILIKNDNTDSKILSEIVTWNSSLVFQNREEFKNSWLYQAFSKIEVGANYKLDYVFRHNPSEKITLIEEDNEYIAFEGFKFIEWILEGNPDTDVEDMRNTANEIATLWGTYLLSKERYLKIKSEHSLYARDLVQKALEFGNEDEFETMKIWTVALMLIKAQFKEVEDTTMTIYDIVESTDAEIKELIGRNWKKNPLVQRLNLKKKEVIDLLRQGRMNIQCTEWS